MNSTTKIYTVICTCSSCTKNAIGGILQNAQTFKRHNDANKLLDIGSKNRETHIEMGDVSDTLIDYEDNYSIISAETTVQSVSFLREDEIFQFEESDVKTTSLASDNGNPDSSDESEDESEVEVAGVENFGHSCFQFCLLRKGFVSKFYQVLTLNYYCYLYYFGSGKLYDWGQSQ
ncbi:hypothetical protein PHYBLDRAFT_174078 [Phycomyces blakesleeanus NRRL 1555(-)]|uniref:Uncharacterized protein n=1 Tax=Phycomyces blakesleeanus (strain ATCC 8743b / DSM 1359 / FGSC 10004 / NBRC 33097 / NRRL 1555) TaxID=763407 RepID=A0A162TK26_PHYB8|nr:hypothetical protein PHYBLDRAFT_174078 [Phycomyces blakesleeanus NRRL 1555(-)]OAD67753.1 hypothetical protein PHYBLDRAFT_174078 [Phycomyces blakesleeanus NRRL 1555(-)]|eukprot:XP_018285793.1 hypothetical protein PHYBLDRAFT_174078 [Phycomyces blakesleeanus NRRL 1555(-)]